ncbi:hypothetical protein RHGRI_022609 [Rhododendron griersonianum]|uniref:peroxidase n=1 Tax=Rhododendron griersonianum TaxID=479676 RepID=A0AAV6J748_9ERIC|nr:hypothetical protein RHGRI_022609 [Rhododendron griersonianum]
MRHNTSSLFASSVRVTSKPTFAAINPVRYDDVADPGRPSPSPIRVPITESEGGGVFATRAIGAGELIHAATPILCSMVRDTSLKVRVEAFDALGEISMVSEEILLQTLSEKHLSVSLQESKPTLQRHGLKEKIYSVLCSTKPFEIPASNSAGVFVHGLESEFSEALEALRCMALFDRLKVQEAHMHMLASRVIQDEGLLRKHSAMDVTVTLLSSLIIFSITSIGSGLSLNYYDQKCPNAESIVANAVKDAMMKDQTVPAALLRMHFHDCFIRGCDASVLLNSVGKNSAEKDGPPNVSLHAFYVIDSAKQEVESKCPGVVSCADILALSARDAVVLSGGPTWDVPKGRKDGRTSKASETVQLPAPTFNIAQLQQSFSQRGLSMEDLVALSGGHTLGFSHCSSFEKRIQNFNSTNNIDPSMHPSFASSLKSICPIHNKVKNAGTTMDPSSTTFDNTYYKLILQKKSLFSSDQALLTSPNTKDLISKFASSQEAFFKAFVNSMIKMSSITGGQEVRKDCRVVN